MAGACGAGDVRVAGQRVQHHHHVVPVGGQLAPPLYGDGHVVDDGAALERQRTDVDDRDLALGGQRVNGHIKDCHVMNLQTVF